MNSLQVLIALLPLVTGLHQPVQIVWPHDHTGNFFIAQQDGLILARDQRIYLDLRPLVSCCENGGLLSVVFHPNFALNGRLFVQYVDLNGNTVIASYVRNDPASARILLVAEQPKDNVPNHHGGTLQFGPDGDLYASIGDGGAFVSVTNRAQRSRDSDAAPEGQTDDREGGARSAKPQRKGARRDPRDVSAR